MNLPRLAILAVALLSAVGAGVIALNLSATEAPEPVIITAPSEPTVKLAEVLVATRDVEMGGSIGDALGWQSWPADALGPALIVRSARPNAVEDLKGSLARQSFVTGEPVREDKLIRTDSGFMSVVLPEGKRAVAIPIVAETSAGGFILPNDHVDIIMSRKVTDTAGVVTGIDTQTVLRNIRVLAIDQTIGDKEGTKVVVGSTATIEVDPEQAEAVTAAQQLSDRLVLSLRSLEDSIPGGKGYASFLLSGDPKPNRVRVVRYGQATDVTTKK